MEDKTVKGKTTDYRDYIEEFDLQRYWLVLKRRWLPASLVFLAAIAAAAYYGSTRKPSYQSTGKLLFKVDQASVLTGIGAEFGRLEAINEFGGDPLTTQSRIITATPVLQETIQDLNLRSEEGEYLSPGSLRSNLSVEPLETSDIISISYVGGDPQKAAAIVNQVMENYVEFNVAMNRSEATAAREFVERQLPKAEAEVEQAAEALRQFKAQNQVFALDTETTATVDAVNTLNDRINQTSAALADARTQAELLRGQLDMPLQQALTIDKLSQAPGVQQALVDLQTVQTQLASEKTRYTDNHPIVQNLVQQEAALQDLLSRRVSESLGRPVSVSPDQLQMTDLTRDLTSRLAQAEVNRSSLVEQIQALNQARNAYISRAQSFPALEKQQLELEQRLTAASMAYETLLQRLQEVQLAESQQVGSAQIIETALVPTSPTNSGRANYLAAGVLGGGVLAVAAAFLLDLIDKSVKTVKDAEVLLGYTPLGIIPKFSTHGEDSAMRSYGNHTGISPRVVTLGNQYPFISGAYQMLQANLKFMSSDTPLKSFVVTSSIAKEGKSEVCANLAATMAQAGKRVLLVDADLRSPTQHHIWGVLNTVGLSHVLVGEGRLEEALIEVSDNLTLLTAGVVPPNPLALLDSERMAGIVNSLSQQYDYVIFDTPPLAGAADSAVLGKATNGVLLVLKPRMVDSASAVAAKSLLSRADANVLGFIANGVDVRNEHDDYISLTRSQIYGKSDRSSEKAAVR
jgi:capsular exopolysaccharide synthesis family protein